MELFQLKVFHLVSEYKSFTAASKSVFRSQSATSYQIKLLEDELETKLFKRIGSKRVELTPEGILFKELTRDLYYKSNSIVEQFASARKKYTDSIVNFCSTGLITCLVIPDVIEKTAFLYPNMKIRIHNPPGEKYFNMLRNNETDFCLGYFDSYPADIMYHEFFNSPWYIVTKDNHPLVNKQDFSLEEMLKYPLIMPSMNSIHRNRFDNYIKSKNLSYTVSIETPDTPANSRVFIMAGMGIFIAVSPWLKYNDITGLFIKDISNILEDTYKIGIIYRKNKIFSSSAKIFLKLLAPDFDGFIA
ncbi:MAG TPA: hypothetical protein DD381_05640 [Lentisphaeria bacterium]|nr:MAG: hypothetical protein A2X47_08460 [Lentisphaerae bacterium GWF2_38_69]HBM15809.1 hypothetical protein [Lentisphaeria bacterium]